MPTPEEEHKSSVLAAWLRVPQHRFAAHQIIFRHRHPQPSPDFHEEITTTWHSRTKYILYMAFREAGKSTIAEEAIILSARFHEFNYALLVGATYDKAVERLAAVKYEIEGNDILTSLYGELRGETWNEADIILSNGVRIEAVGRGQEVRGKKHRQWRPDMIFLDDVEMREDVKDAKSRYSALKWFEADLKPCLDTETGRIRMLATPLDPQALPMVFSRDPEWTVHKYPIEHYSDVTGQRTAMWPAKYPLSWIDNTRASFERKGLHHDFMREYMCVAEDVSAKEFLPEMKRVVPRTRTWEAVYVIIDPARTTNRVTSDTTGWVVFSFQRAGKIVIWDGGASHLLPSEIVQLVFDLHDKYRPVEIGVEEDGLNEFLMQPLRIAAAARSEYVPIKPLRAPKGKLDFIRALQPVFASGEIELAKDIDAWAQFLAFPTGKIDFPNACAYILPMRPAQVVFPGFDPLLHIVPGLTARRSGDFWLAVNANATMSACVLGQIVDGGLCIHAEGIREGSPATALPDIIASVQARIRVLGSAASGLDVFAPPAHFDRYDIIGLRSAGRSSQVELSRGADINLGCDSLRSLLQGRSAFGDPLLRICDRLRWVTNGLASGYHHTTDRTTGRVIATPVDNVYRLFVEAVACVAGVMCPGGIGATGPSASSFEKNYSQTKDGRSYISLLPSAAPLAAELKLPRR